MLIDRYIARLFLGYFFAGLIVFVTLYVTVDFMSQMGHYQASPAAFGVYYLFAIPAVVYQMLPVACLMATIFTLSTLNRNNELVALFSSGMSLARISTPILVFVVLISATGFWLNDRLIPIINQKKNYVLYVEIKKQPGLYSTVKTNKIWYRSNNILFNIQTLQPEKSEAQGITMYYFNSAWQLIQLVAADRVQFKGSLWELKNGSVTLFTKESSFPMTQDFAEKTITMGEDTKDLQSTTQMTESLSLRELGRYIQKNKEAGLDTLRYEVDYQAKFGFAFAAFVMSFIGIPFSVSRQRSGGTAFNIGICIGLAFVYWAAYSSGLTLGKHGLVPPLVAAWVPNGIMVVISTILLLRLKK